MICGCLQHLYAQLHEHERSTRTVKLVHSVIHRSLNIAQKHGLIGRNPASILDPPKVEVKEMQAWDDNQARQFLIAAKDHRYEALFYLALSTGMRKGELLGLKWEDVDWISETVNVRRQVQRVSGKGFEFSPPKTQAGRRAIKLGPEIMRQLSEHRKRQDNERTLEGWCDHDMVFPSTIGTPTDQRRLSNCFQEVIKKSGLREIRFHDLRHTAATLMLLNGQPIIIVSRRLGHSKPSVTLDIYGHYLPGFQEKAAILMDELLTPVAVMAADWQQR